MKFETVKLEPEDWTLTVQNLKIIIMRANDLGLHADDVIVLSKIIDDIEHQTIWKDEK